MVNFKSIKNIFIIGDSPAIENICLINKRKNLKSFYIAPKSYKKKLPNFITIKKVSKLSNEFKIFVKSNVKVNVLGSENTIKNPGKAKINIISETFINSLKLNL